MGFEGIWTSNFEQFDWSLPTVSACSLCKWSFTVLTHAEDYGFVLVHCQKCLRKQDLSCKLMSSIFAPQMVYSWKILNVPF